MTHSLISLLPDSCSGERQEAMAAHLRAYGALTRVEAWRWTPLNALFASPRRLQHADYQLDIPEGCDESLDRDGDKIVRNWLELTDAPFAWLNFATLDETLTLTVPAGVTVDEAIAVNIDAARRALQCSRVHLRVEKGAKAAFWLDYRASSAAAQLPVLSIEVADEAQVQGVLWLSGESDTAQLAHLYSELGERSVMKLNAVQESGALVRLDVEAQLTGEFADFHFGGLQTLDQAEVGDYHVVVRHLNENGTSRQVVRGALAEQSKGIFDGLIYVAHGAQLTDAQQDSRYMLMSESATSHSVPRLEIYADDVKCAHGSTVGFLDPEALFYLRSRGIDEAQARKMLTLSFLHEAVVVDAEVLHDALHEAISAVWMEGQDDDADVA